jgi:hypothetical protein
LLSKPAGPSRSSSRSTLLQGAVTTEAAFTTTVIICRARDAHLAVLDVAPDRAQEGRMRDLFEKMVAKHGLAIADARPNTNTSTASVAALTGREPDVVASQARLADLVLRCINMVTYFERLGVTGRDHPQPRGCTHAKEKSLRDRHHQRGAS